MTVVWHHRWYHTKVTTKTTLYLPDDLRALVKRLAAAQGVSEAEVIREAIRRLGEQSRPRSRLPLFSSGDPSLAERVDELLDGFGQS